ncbi:MAG: hypothetical protein AVDCRST_MAG19-2682 [uncultured Thermomicrobiales bacterium]|uniref:Uncharacterized protein n=1 Tax=uncultured Thermomicrobiales bacterium TaxID=1645740 RepID=A0A6J4V706_9BACT|nr:MAG: hypothetical protein AVDCRST_MAG19-2682 [uncultured Thermomicrobiales bacterium]
MDPQRFDAMAKAMANGATRRRALRLAGGGLAGALLAAAGLGKRARAQGRPVFTYCQRGLFNEEGEKYPYITGPGTDDFEIAKPCGPAHDCNQGKTCVALVNPVGQLLCRCVDVGLID